MFNEDFYSYTDGSHGAMSSGSMSPEMLMEFEQQIEADELNEDQALAMLRGEYNIG